MHDALRDLGVVTHDDDEALVIAVAGGGALLIEDEDLAVGHLPRCLRRGVACGVAVWWSGWWEWGGARKVAAPAVCCRATR